MKKLEIAFIVIFAICGYAFYANSADILTSGTCGTSAQACSYTIDSEGLLHIYGNGKISGQVFAGWSAIGQEFGRQIKDVVIDKGITEIGYQSFHSLQNLLSVSIPNTVTKIDGYAFYNAARLKSIVIPKSVTEIGSAAFLYSYNLQDVTIEGKDVQIGWEVWGSTGITSYANSNSKVSVKAGSLTEQRMKAITSSKVTYNDIPKRRIYSVKEANEALGDYNRNTFSINYQ